MLSKSLPALTDGVALRVSPSGVQLPPASPLLHRYASANLPRVTVAYDILST